MQLIWNIIGYLMFSGVLVIFFQTFFIGIMHLLMPKDIVNSYFKEPYFNTFELTLFTGWPYAFFRTLMFVRLIVQPSSGKKRKLPNISGEVPITEQLEPFTVFVVPIEPVILFLNTFAILFYLS